MIKLEKTEVVGWEHAIRGMRNPKNAWGLIDSEFADCISNDKYFVNYTMKEPIIGPNDHKTMMRLSKAGTDHRKYMRMIAVYVDITAPLYWWKEFDTYKVGTVANSCSTMHKIGEKEFDREDFSWDHLFTIVDNVDDWYSDCEEENHPADNILDETINALNFYRKKYQEAKVKPMKEESKRKETVKKYWWQMIQLLPSSYNQKRTIMLNYEVLANMYKSRRNHKLDEWHVFCDWIEKLPYSEIITAPSKKGFLDKQLVIPKLSEEEIEKMRQMLKTDHGVIKVCQDKESFCVGEHGDAWVDVWPDKEEI